MNGQELQPSSSSSWGGKRRRSTQSKIYNCQRPTRMVLMAQTLAALLLCTAAAFNGGCGLIVVDSFTSSGNRCHNIGTTSLSPLFKNKSKPTLSSRESFGSNRYTQLGTFRSSNSKDVGDDDVRNNGRGKKMVWNHKI